MSGTGDYGYEMIQRSHLDDTSFEQLVAGRTVPGQELLVSFVEDVHVATSAEASAPSSELVTLFVEGLSTENGDLLVTAASNVTGPAAGGRTTEVEKAEHVRDRTFQTCSTGPGRQDGGSHRRGGAGGQRGSVHRSPSRPRAGAGGGRGRAGGHRHSRRHVRRAPGRRRAPAGAERRARGHRGGRGPRGRRGARDPRGRRLRHRRVRRRPQRCSPGHGRQFGEDTSNTARETFQPAERPTADSNPGSTYRPEGAQQPAEQPTADSNPGSSFVPEAGPGAGIRQPR